MKSKLKKIVNFLLYAVLDCGIYGFAIYLLFTWLSGYSLLSAYLANFAFIIFALAMDEFTFKYLHSKTLIEQFKKAKEKDRKKGMRSFNWIMDSFVSFKTMLYFFYIFILIFSQVIQFNPEIVSENLNNFILANNYSILFLIAFDQLIIQFTKDRIKMEKLSTDFNKSFEGEEK